MTGPGARFAVRVRPGARRDAVGGCWAGPRGDELLVSVAAPAVDGKANAAVCAVLARTLGVRRNQVTITAGERARDKLVTVLDAPADLPEQLARLRGQRS